jgi:hypothetical protein
MCRYYSDQWRNGDECVHAPPRHPQIAEVLDTYIGQCVVCCDSNGDGVPDQPLDDPNTPYLEDEPMEARTGVFMRSHLLWRVHD